MKRSAVNLLLGAGFILPLALLLFPMPYQMWHPAVSTALRVLSAASAQALCRREGRNVFIRLLPAAVTALMAGWGVYLYCTAASWADATLAGLLMDYVSPFLGAAAVLTWFWYRRKTERI